MLIALISDIHANYQALQAVVNHARQRNPDVVFWCLGDVFGRGPGAPEVWDELTRFLRPQYWVAGNHDWGLVGLIENYTLPNGLPGGEFGNPSDWQATLRQREILRADNDSLESIGKVIVSMPVMISPADGVYLAHGSFGKFRQTVTPWECVNEYLLDRSHVTRTFQILQGFVADPTEDERFVSLTGGWTLPALMIVGHSHVRGFFRFKVGCQEETIKIDQRYNLPNNPAEPILVNPGSVGFSRGDKRDHCASYALLDLDEHHPWISFHRVPYNRPETLMWIEDRRFPAWIKTLLDGTCAFSHMNKCPCGVLK